MITKEPCLRSLFGSSPFQAESPGAGVPGGGGMVPTLQQFKLNALDTHPRPGLRGRREGRLGPSSPCLSPSY